MKIRIILLAMMTPYLLSGYAQADMKMLDKEFESSSQFKAPQLSEKTINNLEIVGRVWGFLKYYHPEIGKGNYNWDFELFRFLQKYQFSSSDSERDQFILNWINSLGEISKCKECIPTGTDAFRKPDLKWIETSNLSTALKDKLLFVYQNRHQGKHHYIGMMPNVGNPEFKNENDYASMSFPDDGYRLLALFRHWNMIHYFFPYKHLMDKDWNQILKEFIPIFLQASNKLEYELATIQLIWHVQDTHANLWGAIEINNWKGKYYPPIHVRFIENKLVVTDYYNPELKSRTGLEVGDAIIKINGMAVEEIIKEKSRYYPASNEPTRLRDISADLLRSNANKINIAYVRGKNAEQSMSLKLYPWDSLAVYRWYRPTKDKCYKLLDNNIGYITLASIKTEDIPRIKEEFINTKGIIIDIRNYPSAFVPFDLGSYFVSSTTPFVKFTHGNVDNPGEFTFTHSIEIPKGRHAYAGQLIVLVNELSQSQAEYTAMAFRAGNNTTIIGSTTAGADGNISRIPLPGRLQTVISGIGVYYPNEKETQRIGIVPDVEVKPTIEGIRTGRDELLEKAIEMILKKPH